MKRLLSLLILIGLLLPLTSPANAAIKAGTTCTKLNSTKTYAGYKYKCIKSGKKLVWGKGVKVVIANPTPSPSKPTAIGDPVGAIGSSSTPTPSTTATPTSAVSASASPTPSKTKPAPVKYKNCKEAGAAGVTPIRKETDPELYALNMSLDGDKDGDACEN